MLLAGAAHLMVKSFKGEVPPEAAGEVEGTARWLLCGGAERLEELACRSMMQVCCHGQGPLRVSLSCTHETPIISEVAARMGASLACSSLPAQSPPPALQHLTPPNQNLPRLYADLKLFGKEVGDGCWLGWRVWLVLWPAPCIQASSYIPKINLLTSKHLLTSTIQLTSPTKADLHATYMLCCHSAKQGSALVRMHEARE
jgi:hypothetical protein